jgi:predicted TIM-barrel fold metal-dependent hydrolase
MDEEWRDSHRSRHRTTAEEPSFYFRRQCMISCEAGDGFIMHVVERVGEDYLMAATDYPHADAIDKFPERTIGDLSGNTKIPADIRRKILWDNPARFYRIEAAVAV